MRDPDQARDMVQRGLGREGSDLKGELGTDPWGRKEDAQRLTVLGTASARTRKKSPSHGDEGSEEAEQELVSGTGSP